MIFHLRSWRWVNGSKAFDGEDIYVVEDKILVIQIFQWAVILPPDLKVASKCQSPIELSCSSGGVKPAAAIGFGAVALYRLGLQIR